MASPAKKQASAFRLKAELLRAGVVFPQDDEAATKALISRPSSAT
jgi:hypothetical protein